MTRTAVPNQRHAPPLAKRFQQLWSGAAALFTVILVQTARAPLTTVHEQPDQEINRGVAFVFKRLTFNRPRAQGLFGTRARQGLQMGFFSESQNEFSACHAPIDSFLKP